MGNNTVAMFLNDQADALERCPKQVLATLRRCLSGGYGEENGPGQMQVLPSCHADMIQIIAAGGNSISMIGHAHWRDDPETIIRKLADQHGFRLVRKPATKESAK